MIPYINTLDEFHYIVKNNPNKLIIIDYSAKWCSPCTKISPLYENLSLDYPNVLFYKVDVDINKELVSNNNIESLPTFHFYKNNFFVDEVIGANFGEVSQKLLHHI